MKDKKRNEILLKVIKKVYDENADLQKSRDASMMEVCAEEGVSPKQTFFCCFFFAFLCFCLYGNWLSKQTSWRNKVFCVKETAYGNLRDYFKEKSNFQW